MQNQEAEEGLERSTSGHNVSTFCKGTEGDNSRHLKQIVLMADIS